MVKEASETSEVSKKASERPIASSEADSMRNGALPETPEVYVCPPAAHTYPGANAPSNPPPAFGERSEPSSVPVRRGRGVLRFLGPVAVLRRVG